jgi:hypothetical protein
MIDSEPADEFRVLRLGSEHIATVPAEVLDEVRAKLKPLLGT